MTLDRRGRTVARAGSPLRRLRICHPADSERAHERAGRTGSFGASCAEPSRFAVGAREGCTQRAATAGGRAPRRSELRCSEGLLGASPTSGVARVARVPLRGAAVSRHRYGRLRARPTRCSTISTRISAPRSPSRTLPLAILAPAGSGKTRVLTRRIAWRVREQLADARHVLAVTFTRRAAGELVDRLDALGVDAAVTAGTFHALALAQLRRRADRRAAASPRASSIARRGCSPRCSGAVGRRRARSPIADVATEIEWAKARMIPPERYAAAARAAERRLPALAGRARRPLRRATRPRSGSGAGSTSTISSVGAPTRSNATRTSRPRSAGASGTSSSTSSRTRRRSSSGSCGRGSATAPTSASSATARRRSTRSRAPTRRRSSTSRATSPAAARSRSRTTTARPTRSSPSPRPRSARRRASSATRRARFAPPTAAATIHAFDDDAARSRRGRRRVLARVHRRRAVASHGASCSAPTRSRRCSKPRSRAGASRSASPARSGSRRGPRCACCSIGCARPTARAPAATVHRAPRRPRRRRRRRADARRSPDAERADAARRRPAVRIRRRAAHAPRRVAPIRARLPRGRARPGLGRRLRLVARPRDARRVERRTGRRPRDVPPGQGARVAGRVRHRARTRPGPDLVGHDAIGPRRGATVAARRARPRRRLAALLVGTRAHRVRPAGDAPADPVARRARTRGREHPRRAGRSARRGSAERSRPCSTRRRPRRRVTPGESSGDPPACAEA